MLTGLRPHGGPPPRPPRRLVALAALPRLGLYVTSRPKLAAAIFRDAGVVVLPEAVESELCQELLEGCREEEQKILELDELHEGNRGEGRYSLGAVWQVER